jgi:hypothetical protein
MKDVSEDYFILLFKFKGLTAQRNISFPIETFFCPMHLSVDLLIFISLGNFNLELNLGYELLPFLQHIQDRFLLKSEILPITAITKL